MRAFNFRKQWGFTAIELMVVLIVAVGALSFGGGQLSIYLDNLANQAAADHAKQVRDAAQKYVKDNYAALQAVATATTPATVTVAMLQSTHEMDSSVTAVNGFGQSYSILVLQPTAGQLQTLILTTGGETIPELGIRRIAQLIGAQGGYVSSTNTAVATGTYGGWSTALPGNYGVSPGAGHIAMALFFADSGTVSDYMYRNSVPGHPELNTMNTPLNMAATATANAACTTTGAIAQDGTGKVLSCNGTKWQSVSMSGLNWKGSVASFAALPATPAAGDTYRITGLSNHAFTWDSTNNVWQGLVIDSSGNLSLPGLIYAAGSNSSYGAITMQGSKNGWSGINFKDSTGASAGTLMMHPSYSGFFNAADNAWRWMVDNSGNSTQPGSITTTLTVADNSSCAGYPSGAIAQSSVTPGLILSCQYNGTAWVWKGGATLSAATVGSACSTPGVLAYSSIAGPNGSGMTLYCASNGYYVKASGALLFGGSYGFYVPVGGGARTCQAINPATGGCSCPTGYGGQEYPTGQGWVYGTVAWQWVFYTGYCWG